MKLGHLKSLTEDDRRKLTEEVISFISMVAKDIQDLNRQLDVMTSTTDTAKNGKPSMAMLKNIQIEYYQQVISSLLQVSSTLFYFIVFDLKIVHVFC